VVRHIRTAFAPDAAERVLARLARWRISYEPEPPDERLVAAVVLYADGDERELHHAIEQAERDWRDLLVAAGLASSGWRRKLRRRMGRSR